MITWLSIASLWSQNSTSGQDFWLTFGKNHTGIPSDSDLQIRIVNGNHLTEGRITFTNLGTWVDFSIPAHQVYTYALNGTERAAVYNETMGISNKSIHITTDYQVTVYASNHTVVVGDVTNVLPITTLGIDYYNISNRSSNYWNDAYAVVAIENNTHVYHDGTLSATLNNAGDVYYRTLSNGFYGADMTGTHITSDKPVALFAVSVVAHIGYEPGIVGGTINSLFQQLAPVNTWGRNFFVPVSHLPKDYVRIVASENNTNISQTGGTIKPAEGGQTSLNNLQAGQFVELEIILSNNGCYIQSDKPVGVCAYLTSHYATPPSSYNLGIRTFSELDTFLTTDNYRNTDSAFYTRRL